MTPAPAHPLVLIPGLGLRAESWAPTVRSLGRGGMLGAASVRTLPGYGEPQRAGGSLAPAVLARAVVDRLEHDRPSLLLALSAGCQVAAHVALQAPDLVGGLVLVGPTTDPRALTWPRLVRRWVATACREPVRQLPALVRQYAHTGLPAMARAMDAARRDRLEDVLPLLGCPTLLLRGAHDRIAPEDWLASLAGERPPRAGRPPAPRHWHSLPAGAHMVPFTHGELVADAVRDWLPDLDR